MESEIESKLDRIEKQEDVRILYACESGSRAWGFESPDSDYDVRFIYVRPRDNYLRLDETRDVIEQQSGKLDINGWDLDKTLKLARKSNPVLFEWLNSPIMYRSSQQIDDIKKAIKPFYSTKSSVYHYLHMAQGNYDSYIAGRDTVKHKKYLYVLRPILACLWVLDEKSVPPMEFAKLIDSKLDPTIRRDVDDLLAAKRASAEMATGQPIDSLNNYIASKLDEIANAAAALPAESGASWDELNKLFVSIV